MDDIHSRNRRGRLALIIRSVRSVLPDVRKPRFRRMPRTGWGRGWRTLVFLFDGPGRKELHVLAPVDGDAFDWPLLRDRLSTGDWPVPPAAHGHELGALAGAGHHLYATTSELGPQRLSTGRLIPGEFGGGTDVRFVLIDVRDPSISGF